MRGLCWGLTFTLEPEGEREAATRGARGKAEHRSVVNRGNATPNGSETTKGLSKSRGLHGQKLITARRRGRGCKGPRGDIQIAAEQAEWGSQKEGGEKEEEVSGWGNRQRTQW